MTLPKTLQKYANIIESVVDERKTGGDGIWVYLVDGWWCPEMECPYVHEDTMKACADMLSRCEPKDEKSNPQRISSAKTSLKQVPMLHRVLAPKGVLGPYNLDLGGGRFDLGTEFLAKHGVRSMVYDPYNRSEQHNRTVLSTLGRIRGAETVTCANVLNVIREASARAEVIKQARAALRPGGTAYFWVHEGSKADRKRGPRQTGKDSWQNFKPTAWYLPEIRKVFPKAFQRGRVIVAPTR